MKHKNKSFPQTFTFFYILFYSVLSQQLTDERKRAIIVEDYAERDATRMDGLSGRSHFSNRKSLPNGDLFAELKLNNHMSCGGTFALTMEGYYAFNLSPRNQPCHYTFLGSKNEKCTAAILCKEKITLEPPTKLGCEKEWLILSDGTEGQMSGCGTFSFSGTPRKPRNNGTDLSLHLKGTSPVHCIVFCEEELGTGGRPSFGINPVKKLGKNRQYQGFKMETDCKCGLRKKSYARIVGGENAMKFEFPWIGAIVFKGKSTGRKPFCGGSLVSDRYFMSAAHCFAVDKIRPDEIQVVLHAHVMDKRVHGNPNDPKYQDVPGWNLPDQTDESEESIRMDIQEIKTHPLFDDKTFDYDIAILKFTRAVNLKKGKVAPICLPNIKETFSFKDGDKMVVAGWGRPREGAPAGARTLQKLDVPYFNLRTCEEHTVPTKRHLCAGFLEGGKDACSGDSGGPLTYLFNRENNQYLLSGIVSAGVGCARKENLGLYSDVQELIQWAYQQMPDAIYCPRS